MLKNGRLNIYLLWIRKLQDNFEIWLDFGRFCKLDVFRVAAGAISVDVFI